MRGDDVLAVLGFDLIPFDRDIGAAGNIADEAAACLAFEEGIVGTLETYVLGIRSCQAKGTIGQQAERIQSFIDHFRDKAAFVPAFADEREAAKLLVFLKGNVGGDLVIAISGAIPLPEHFPVRGGGLVAEEVGQAEGKGVDIRSKPAAILFAKTIGAEVDIDIEPGDGSTQHTAVFAEDGTPFGIELDPFLVEAVAQASPVGALYALDIEYLAQNDEAQHDDADKAQIDSP